jgi:UDP-N-acetylglucosamine--N-acetylmuramyl-(pentapeptide) pyrophosphoryl-undecaprenol N-acetylglucosamine transferase
MSKPKKILFCGGKSVGHLAPLVAIWREVVNLDAHATSMFVCTNTPSDAAFLAREDVPFWVLSSAPHRLLTMFWLPFTFVKCVFMLKRETPSVIVSKGGAVSAPVLLAASVLKIPALIHESDAVSGRATRTLAYFAQARCRGLPWDREREPSVWKNAVFTGNPVRASLTSGSRDRGLEITGFSGKKPILLVMGGSQGALSVNEAVTAALPTLLPLVDIVHLTGHGKELRKPEPGYFAIPFANDELPHLYAISDIALSRAGAGAISELALFGIPTILVPLEGLAQNHQVKNAELLAKLGACVVVKQSSLGKELVPTIERMLKNEKEREGLSMRMKQMSSPEAAKNIAQMCLSLAAKGMK